MTPTHPPKSLTWCHECHDTGFECRCWYCKGTPASVCDMNLFEKWQRCSKGCPPLETFVDKIARAIAIAAHKMLQGTGYSFVFAIWQTDKPIKDDTIAMVAHPQTPHDQAAEACDLISAKLKSRIIH